ncbi:glutamate racemase [Candidatus Roizmanbacteria bacterium]|nr:glutamate racemase [Candidatus Roizmanbacteria bacterium]
MNNYPIGILDSGVGGLTIWKEIVTLLPRESTIYIGDSKNCPYGSKSVEKIYLLAKRLVKFLVQKQCKIIVVACNTISVSCLDQLRKDFSEIPIIGTVPVVKTADQVSKKKRIGILSTSATSQSTYQRDLIQKFASDCDVIDSGTDTLVPFIEEGKIEEAEKVLTTILKPYIDAKIDVLVLGCSHFPFLKTQIQHILGSHITILDSGSAIAQQVKRVLAEKNLSAQKKIGKHLMYTTGNKLLMGKFVGELGYNRVSVYREAV